MKMIWENNKIHSTMCINPNGGINSNGGLCKDASASFKPSTDNSDVSFRGLSFSLCVQEDKNETQA